MSETHGSDQAVKQNQRVRQKRLFGSLFCFLAKTDHTHHMKQTKSTAILSLTAGGVIKWRLRAGPSNPSGGCTYTWLMPQACICACHLLALFSLHELSYLLPPCPFSFWKQNHKITEWMVFKNTSSRVMQSSLPAQAGPSYSILHNYAIYTTMPVSWLHQGGIWIHPEKKTLKSFQAACFMVLSHPQNKECFPHIKM